MTEFAAVHPAADLFPMLDDAALDQMAADIKARGLVHPIVLTPEGVLLDGRNRVEACRRAGITPRTEIYTGDDPTAYVISVNLERRHLSEDERAFLALELVPLFEAEQDKGGRPTNGEQKPPDRIDGGFSHRSRVHGEGCHVREGQAQQGAASQADQGTGR